MTRWAAALLGGLLLAGCGDDTSTDNASTTSTPALTSTIRQPVPPSRRDRMSSCLTGLGFRLTGGTAPADNADAPEYQLVFDGRQGGGYIGFYKNVSRATRVATHLRENAARVSGAASERHGAINVVWVDLPGKAARASVRACLTV